MRVLVTGHKGYIGTIMVPMLIESGHEVVGLDSDFYVINHYREVDILINPSLREAFGRSLIEAMACQMPVVATRVGGMVEIVEDAKTGLWVNPGDATALAEAIIGLLSDENLRKSMAKAGRQRVLELFSWDQIVENLLRQYKSICRCDGNE